MSAEEIDETLPEVVKNFLRSGATLQEIRLDAQGKWTHEGLDFENPKIIGLFSRSVSRTEGGTWVLEIGRFTYPIEVDDTGFFVERVDLESRPPRLTLSDETEEDLDVDSLMYGEGGRLYCTVKDGEFRARFKRGPYYKLAEQIEGEEGEWRFVLDGESYPVASAD